MWAFGESGTKKPNLRNSIDPYHVPDILDLKQGWTGINNAHAILKMHNFF